MYAYNVHAEYGVHTSYMLYVLIRGSSRESNSLAPTDSTFPCSITPEQKESIDQECIFWTFNVCVEGFWEEKKQRGFSAPPHSLLSGFLILTSYYVYITFINSVHYEPWTQSLVFQGLSQSTGTARPTHWFNSGHIYGKKIGEYKIHFFYWIIIENYKKNLYTKYIRTPYSVHTPMSDVAEDSAIVWDKSILMHTTPYIVPCTTYFSGMILGRMRPEVRSTEFWTCT